MIHHGASVACPYCGEPTVVPFDADGGSAQSYVSDCEVCCRPMEIRAALDEDGNLDVWVTTEDGM